MVERDTVGEKETVEEKETVGDRGTVGEKDTVGEKAQMKTCRWMHGCAGSIGMHRTSFACRAKRLCCLHAHWRVPTGESTGDHVHTNSCTTEGSHSCTHIADHADTNSCTTEGSHSRSRPS